MKFFESIGFRNTYNIACKELNMKEFLEILAFLGKLIGLGIVAFVGFTAWLWLPFIVCSIPETSTLVRAISMLVGAIATFATQFFVLAEK